MDSGAEDVDLGLENESETAAKTVNRKQNDGKNSESKANRQRKQRNESKTAAKTVQRHQKGGGNSASKAKRQRKGSESKTATNRKQISKAKAKRKKKQ
jgi:hypothetical protein